jgi:glycosyltransferase involved in cell wall biosynthesis
MKPIISIIVPVYNVEPYLENCIKSILTQNFSNFEVILVNDGSIDKSGKICDVYAQIDTRIKVVHKENGGVSSARNIGVEMALGDFIGFIDGDDRIDENMYRELYRLCVETDSDISICKLGREIDGHIINLDQDIYIKEMDNTEAMKQLFKGTLYRFSLCNKLFRKHCFDNIQFPEGRIHEDLSTTYKLFANSKKIIFTNYIGYIYIKRENSILTSTFNEKRLDAFIGWDEILTFMRERYNQLYKEIIPTFVFWSVDNVFYILNQVINKKERDKYLVSIQKLVRRKYKDIIKNDSLSFGYKYIITLFYFNIRLLIVSRNIKGFLRGQ